MDNDFAGAVRSAMQHDRPRDVEEGVKTLVRAELRFMDPSCAVEETGYFNHSFVPDFIVSWGKGRNRPQREIYLRNSIRSSAAGRDVQDLGDHGPVFLALTPEDQEKRSKFTGLQNAVETTEALVTDVQAVGELVERPGTRSRNPLGPLLSSSLIRGGKGLLREAEAEQLTAATSHAPTDEPTDGVDGVESGVERDFYELIAEHFRPEAAIQLARSARLLDAAFMDEFNPALFDDGDSAQLSDEEMRSLLPYLLKQDGVTENREFWQHLGSMLSLTRLTDLRLDLSGMDLSRVVVPNLEAWTAERAVMVSAPEAEALGPDDLGWRFNGNVLSVVLDAWRLYVANDERIIRTKREEHGAARWTAISDVLSKTLRGAHLQGAGNQISVDADSVAIARRRIQHIHDTIKDSWLIPEVSVLAAPFGVDTGAARVSVSFVQQSASAAGRVSLGELSRISADLLGHRQPVSVETKATYLVDSEGANEDSGDDTAGPTPAT